MSAKVQVSENDSVVHLNLGPHGSTHEPIVTTKAAVSAKEERAEGRDRNEDKGWCQI